MTQPNLQFDLAKVKATGSALYLEALESSEGFDMAVRKYASKYAGSNQAMYEYHMCVVLYAISLRDDVTLEHTRIFAKRMTGLISGALAPMLPAMKKYRSLPTYRVFANGCHAILLLVPSKPNTRELTLSLFYLDSSRSYVEALQRVKYSSM